MATATAIDDRPSCFRFPRGNGLGVDLAELGVGKDFKGQAWEVSAAWTLCSALLSHARQPAAWTLCSALLFHVKQPEVQRSQWRDKPWNLLRLACCRLAHSYHCRGLRACSRSLLSRPLLSCAACQPRQVTGDERARLAVSKSWQQVCAQSKDRTRVPPSPFHGLHPLAALRLALAGSEG